MGRCVDALGIIGGWPTRKAGNEADQFFPSRICRQEACDAASGFWPRWSRWWSPGKKHILMHKFRIWL